MGLSFNSGELYILRNGINQRRNSKEVIVLKIRERGNQKIFFHYYIAVDRGHDIEAGFSYAEVA